MNKSIAFGSTPNARAALKKAKTDGEHIKVSADDKRRRDVEALTRRTERAHQRRAIVQGMQRTRQQKLKLMQGAIIPAAVARTLWDIPSRTAVNQFRTQVIQAIWGQGRKIRAQSIVLGVLKDSVRTDPLAAMIYERPVGARRLMKNKDRLHFAIHTFECQNGRREEQARLQESSACGVTSGDPTATSSTLAMRRRNTSKTTRR